MKYTCKQCGSEFELSDGEIQFYKSKGLSLPKRCKDCRNQNKMNGEAKTYPATKEQNTAKNENENPLKPILENKKLLSAVAVIVAIIVGLFFGNSREVKTNNYTQPTSTTASTTDTSQVFSTEVDNTSEYVAGYEETTYSTAADTTVYTVTPTYTFRNDKLLTSHYEKHGSEVGATSKQDYQRMAANVVTSSDALHKTEAEDGDDVYYIPSTGEFVVVSTDGYIRTYYIASYDYFQRQ